MKPDLELKWPDHDIKMAFRHIPAGSFRMGSRGYYPDEEPVHEVRIPESFWLAETPVTQAQFALWTRAKGIEHENHFKGNPNHPAENMTWSDAIKYCAWLTRVKAGEMPGLIVCLPTEAEWEYACRGGTDPASGGVNTEYYTGDGEAALAEAGWYDGNAESKTHPVKQKKANDFGLYDMHGNVWEWCHDEWDDSAYRKRVDGCEDPGFQDRAGEWNSGLQLMTKENRVRVMRGGSWNNSAGLCRSAYRDWYAGSVWFWSRGFRVCLVPGPAS